MTGRKGLFGSALIYALANALSAGLPFLLLPILTRVLTPEEYGIVTMFTLTVTALGAFTGLSVHGAIGVRYFEQENFNLPTYVASCLVILLISTTVVLIAVMVLMPILEDFAKIPRLWILIAVLVSGAQFVVQTQLALWQAARKPIRYGAMKFAQTAMDAAFSLVLIFALGLTWEGRLIGISMASVLLMLVALFCLRHGAWIKFPYNRTYALDAMRFGVPLIPHVIGGMLIVMVDRVMISNMLGVASAGIYMVAMQVGMVLGLLIDSFNRAFAPWLLESLKSQDAERDRQIVRFTYLYFIIVVVAALLIGAIAPILLSWLVGAEYQSAASSVVYITLGFAFSGMYLMVTNYVFFAGKTAGLAIITCAAGMFNIMANFYLLKVNGIVGAAQAFMLSQLAIFICTWWLAQRSRGMPWMEAARAA
ncbi:oligosaccharide flippase family protein [Chitinimonas arctica]|uniref:Oligosaccharide flippase family protein n=1 Tax=Chitinimonas arctica TaxID=2594795 RepID=A0A516SC55_9NEIS|nr:oligosaccharide flippase family protein [Chitinimonas arctica]QDQ25726.1 oligosaccharide flippase family protein [Chitinimonas arctica]